MIKVDLHSHTVYSKHAFWGRDALSTPAQMIKAARRRGLSGLAITDHQTVKGGLVGRAWARENMRDFIVIPGTEIRTLSGDILALGVDEDIPDGMTVAETVERIHAQSGIAIAAHPFAAFIFRRAVGDEATCADAIEVFNASTRLNWRANRRAYELALRAHKPGTASSDAHIARDVGRAGIACSASSADEILSSIRRGRIETFGAYTPVWDLAYLTARKFARAAKHRVRRSHYASLSQ
ncbi:MAG: PHP domain-containing protein [Candidatus Aenigmatarchaeota archaeon]